MWGRSGKNIYVYIYIFLIYEEDDQETKSSSFIHLIRTDSNEFFLMAE